MITDEDKERVRNASDLLQIVGETVELKQRGRDFWGCCPFHHEKSPSFHVIPATGLWHCFGCGEGGDVFAYIMKRESLDFPDSIRYLAERAGIELSEERGSARRGPKRNRIIECLTEAESFYSMQLLRGKSEGAAAGRAYLGGRGFGSAVCRKWGLGYAPGRGLLVSHLRGKGFTNQEMLAANVALDGRGNQLRDRFFERVMFPIHDEIGRTIAFGGRVLSQGKPMQGGKYVNTSETTVFSKKKHLFAFDRAKEAMAATGEAIVCEGYTDVIAMHEAGFTNTVATMGTALTSDHVKLLERFAKKRIVCMFDGDAAGQKAAERAIQFVEKTKVEIVCVVLPDGQDPMEYLSSHDPDDLRAYLGKAVPLLEFVFTKRLEGYTNASPGRRVAALKEMAQLLAPIKKSVLLDDYALQIAQTLSLDASEVKRLIRATPVSRDPQDASAHADVGRASAGAPARYGTSYDSSAHDDGGYEEYAYEDFAPAGANASMISNDERMQGIAERELLAMIASHPETMKRHSDRIATFMWSDERHEAMAWAMLATPAGSSPRDVIAAAESVVPDAARILSSGRLEFVSNMTAERRATFLLDVVELWSMRREVRTIRGRLRSSSASMADADSQELFRRATELQRRINELGIRVSSVS
ncbi:MAG: DNA primase [Olsenella sp.]|nr:DNA primase [Olsenella sp.]